MATTYSQGWTGYVTGSLLGAKTYDLPDASANGNVAAANPGGMQNCMAQNDLILCKGPDGAQHWYRLDPERSTYQNPYLIFVGP